MADFQGVDAEFGGPGGDLEKVAGGRVRIGALGRFVPVGLTDEVVDGPGGKGGSLRRGDLHVGDVTFAWVGLETGSVVTRD